MAFFCLYLTVGSEEADRKQGKREGYDLQQRSLAGCYGEPCGTCHNNPTIILLKISLSYSDCKWQWYNSWLILIFISAVLKMQLSLISWMNFLLQAHTYWKNLSWSYNLKGENWNLWKSSCAVFQLSSFTKTAHFVVYSLKVLMSFTTTSFF